MISVDKKDLEYMMRPIVNECLNKYKGGEGYFNELDGMIKNNETLMVLFLMYAVQNSGVRNVILSGEIGLKYLKLKFENKIPDYINLMIVNGSLRNGKEITGGIMSSLEVIPENLYDQQIIFIDDSFYSGKTANKVEYFINCRLGKIIRKYVFYDGSKELYAYNYIEGKLKNTQQAINDYQDYRKEHFILKSKVELSCEILLGLFIVLALSLLISFINDGQITAVMAITFLLTIQSVLEILAAIPSLMEHLDEAKRSWLSLKSFINKPKIQSKINSNIYLKDDDAILNVVNINFGYNEILCKDMSFYLYKGQKTLLVGSSGCGKSTLFYVLTRLLDVFSGDMYLQGKSYTQWDKEDWRNHIAPSFQEHHIFNISIRDNFKMFYPDISDEEIWKALDKVQFTAFVQQYGLDYVLESDGTNLSGGQKHRLQLAMCLARKKDIILLDEPTAGLDIVSAHKFLNRLITADKESAILVASHDLSIVDYFDNIIIMEEQRIIEQGKIKSLMKDEKSQLFKLMKYNNLI